MIDNKTHTLNTNDLAENSATKDELSYQYTMLHSVINATPDLIFYKDYLNQDGTYMGCNEAFAKFVGKSIDEIVNRNDIELFGEEIGTYFRGKDKEMLLENTPVTNEEWVTYPDGTKALMNTSRNPFYSQEGNILGVVGLSHDITQLYKDTKSIEQQKKALKDQQELCNLVFETSLNGVLFMDPKTGLFTDCNNVMIKMLRLATKEEVLNHHPTEFSPEFQPDGRRSDEKAEEMIQTALKKGTHNFEWKHKRATGEEFWAEITLSKVTVGGKEIIHVSWKDIDDRKKAEEILRDSQQHLKTIIENEPECVKLVDERGQLLDMNPAGLAMLEADSLQKAQKHTLISYILPQWRAPFIALHKKVMQGDTGTLEFEVKGLKGTHRWLETHAVPLRDTEGKVTSLLGITRDITQRKEAQQRIQYMASYDSLTGLPNRAKLNEQLSYTLKLAKRNQWPFILMFLDIDNFKNINDTLGHDIGDALLLEFSQRLKSVLREEDMLARLGGDEFILLLPNTDTNGAQLVAQKLLNVVQASFSIKQHELTATASIGIALYPTDGLNTETLLKNADTAMYRAKEEGRNNYSFFTEEMQTISKRNLHLSNALHNALSNNELYLVYQPQISLITGSIIGAEALLRWEHPEFGSVSPAEFIPIAENSGLILSIGEWVLRTATAQLKSWMENGMSSIIMSVNLSAAQFRHPNLPDLITEILESTELSAEYLELELTESVTMYNPQGAINIMNSLHKRGIRMSIDDFGTGYSSLSHLKKFKVYKLKIDQSFIRDINTDPEDKAIVAAIINMAQSLGLHTIAEGVETVEQLEYLREQGCKEIQGYYYSKPILAEQFEKFYETQK